MSRALHPQQPRQSQETQQYNKLYAAVTTGDLVALDDLVRSNPSLIHTQYQNPHGEGNQNLLFIAAEHCQVGVYRYLVKKSGGDTPGADGHIPSSNNDSNVIMAAVLGRGDISAKKNMIRYLCNERSFDIQTAKGWLYRNTSDPKYNAATKKKFEVAAGLLHTIAEDLAMERAEARAAGRPAPAVQSPKTPAVYAAPSPYAKPDANAAAAPARYPQYPANHAEAKAVAVAAPAPKIHRNNINIPAEQITALFNAISAGEIEQVQLLVDANPALLSARDHKERNPILAAARYGQVDMYEYLIQTHGLLPSYRITDTTSPEHGATVLTVAAKYNEVRFIQHLEENGFKDLDLSSKHDGKTAIEWLRANAGRDNDLIRGWGFRDKLIRHIEEVIRDRASGEAKSPAAAAPSPHAHTPRPSAAPARPSPGHNANANAAARVEVRPGYVEVDPSMMSKDRLDLIRQLDKDVLRKLVKLHSAGAGKVVDAGNQSAEAERQIAAIERNPALHKYYLYFTRIFNTAIAASIAVQSPKVKDNESTIVEDGINAFAEVAGAVHSGLEKGVRLLALGLTGYLTRERAKNSAKLSIQFGDLSQATPLVEMLARQIIFTPGFNLGEEKDNLRRGVKKAIAWAKGQDITSNIAQLACEHVDMLVKRILDQKVAVRHLKFDDLPRLAAMATTPEGQDVRYNLHDIVPALALRVAPEAGRAAEARPSAAAAPGGWEEKERGRVIATPTFPIIRGITITPSVEGTFKTITIKATNDKGEPSNSKLNEYFAGPGKEAAELFAVCSGNIHKTDIKSGAMVGQKITGRTYKLLDEARDPANYPGAKRAFDNAYNAVCPARVR